SADRSESIGGWHHLITGGGANTVRVGEAARTAALTLVTEVTEAITINGGSVADTIELFGVRTSTALLMSSLEGIDSVLPQLVTASVEVVVNLGHGSDALTMQSVTTAKATLRGGANRDRLRILGTNAIATLDQAEFEA
ncbi:MAG: hypothetical protein SFV81_19200, partial [Pirellulaceae bacterium]|nr:hypothetical protein [Pirellulaceae bacterium]